MEQVNYNLHRFVDRQRKVFEAAFKELEAGKKQGCWMWFIFPQLRGLGTSRKAFVYGIIDIAEAKAYYNHPLLNKRLIMCCEALLNHKDKPIEEIMGEIDALKLRSSMTLFYSASGNPIFKRVLSQFFNGQPDYITLSLIKNLKIH